MPGLPFANLPYLSCSYDAQALLYYDGQLFVFHMTAQVCPFTMTSRLGEEVREEYSSSSLPKFREGGWEAKAGHLHPDLFYSVCKSSGASDAK